MNNDYIFKPASLEDIEEILSLFNSEYNNKLIYKYFLWQYFESYPKSLLYCLINKNKEIVGTFGVQVKNTINGYKCGQVMDMLIGKNFRNKGLFREIGSQTLEYFKDLDFLFVLPNKNGEIAIRKTFNWNTIQKISSFSINPFLIKKLEEKVLNSSITKLNINDYYQFLYTDSYIDWRFYHNPINQYKKISICDNCFAFVKIYSDKSINKIIGDIVYFRYSVEFRENIQLICEIISYFAKLKIDLVTIWEMKVEIIRNVFDEIGFDIFPLERYFCLNILNKNLISTDFYKFSNWLLMPSDTEMY